LIALTLRPGAFRQTTGCFYFCVIECLCRKKSDDSVSANYLPVRFRRRWFKYAYGKKAGCATEIGGAMFPAAAAAAAAATDEEHCDDANDVRGWYTDANRH